MIGTENGGRSLPRHATAKHYESVPEGGSSPYTTSSLSKGKRSRFTNPNPNLLWGLFTLAVSVAIFKASRAPKYCLPYSEPWEDPLRELARGCREASRFGSKRGTDLLRLLRPGRADRLWPTVSFDPPVIKIGGPSAVRGRQNLLRITIFTAEALRHREKALCFQISAPPRLCGEKEGLFHSFDRRGEAMGQILSPVRGLRPLAS